MECGLPREQLNVYHFVGITRMSSGSVLNHAVRTLDSDKLYKNIVSLIKRTSRLQALHHSGEKEGVK